MVVDAPARDALYDSIVVRLSGITDVFDAVEVEDWMAADRLAGEFSDDLRLIQDLGWGRDGTGAALTAPAGVLRRTLSRLKERAEAENRDEVAEKEGLERSIARNLLVCETCEALLEELP